MFDYARISTMLRYESGYCFPLLKKKKTIAVCEDIIRIVLNKGPVKQPYIKTDEKRGKRGIFHYGTRSWEYPWVLEILGKSGKNGKILDCGCGQSTILHEFKCRGFDVTGLDFFVTDNTYSKERYGIPDKYRKQMNTIIKFINGGMNNIPAPDNYFDVVTCLSVMEHVVINTKFDPAYHLQCLDEMKRVLKPGGILICTYDTILNDRCVFAGTKEWGVNGWYYADDINYLDLKFFDTTTRIKTREEIMKDEDTFFIPPDIYFQLGFGNGFDLSDTFHRLTSVGFALVK